MFSSKSLGRVLETRYYSLCLLTYVLSAAALVNVTFDDTFPNPRGGPSIIYGGGWFNSANCSGCIPGLDENRMSGKTWHAHFFDFVGAPPASAPVSSNHTGSAAVPFKGTAIYVFCALPRAQAIDINFSLDGLTVGNFTRASTGSSGFDYNVLVYANTTARPGAHQLIIENGINSNRSALVFDSAIYTHGSSPKHPRLTTAAIVGVVISVMVVLALLILGVLLYHRRKIRQGKLHEPSGPPTNNLVATPYPRSNFLNGMRPTREKLRGFTIRHPRWLRRVDEVSVMETESVAPPAYSPNRSSCEKIKPPPPPIMVNE